MRYVSTRGSAPDLGFDDVLLTGLARDGGLYVPSDWPKFSAAEWREMRGLPYDELAVRVCMPFLGDVISEDDFADIATDAYSGFDHDAVAPLKQLSADTWLMELFHGPTLSFKGIDNATYYRLSGDNPREYVDHTGVGNSLDFGEPRVVQLVLDSLRYWVQDMRVDGFRFDLASTLCREDPPGCADRHFAHVVLFALQYEGHKDCKGADGNAQGAHVFFALSPRNRIDQCAQE